ncbi:MAG: single-stranded-DNA-specific exonuclease RecJ [Planctomycetes bacterium]|nr:single-stranded-DNA-specific exonuclease RecJ [Planctomycetota bacterium]
MRGLLHRWLLRPPPATEERLSGLALPPLLERILLARGLDDEDTVRRFRDPKLTDLHDPRLLPGVDAAAERLVDAVRGDEQVAIYGDYDVDGITATAILYHVIRAVAPNARLVTYVPHRIDEGYGLNAEALRHLRDGGADLVVSVDCGITAVEPVAAARAAGLDVIVTDHHALPEPEGQLPDAILVHPRLPGSEYPFGELCGAGVAFKLAWRFAMRWCNSERVSGVLKKTLVDMLPLVALGTIADVVPLLGENRILTTWGLRFIKETPISGLRALIEASDLMGERIDSHKVGFVLGPRLNACGRMGHAAEAVRLLTEARGAEAEAIARSLADLNKERQQVERRITEAAGQRAETLGMTGDDRRVIVLADPSWHAGVVGIACSRLVERFGRPTVLLQEQGDVCRGSARSIDAYSIHAGLTRVAEHLVTYGGHAAAAGLTVETRNLEAFTEALTADANARIEPDQLVPTLNVDCDADLRELDLVTVRQIAQLSPFGRANRAPALRVVEATITEAPRPLGATGRHVALRLRGLHDASRRTLRGIWWGKAEVAERLHPGVPLDVVIEPKINNWQGNETVEAEIKDVRIRD